MKKSLLTLSLLASFLVSSAYATSPGYKDDCLSHMDDAYEPVFKTLDLRHCDINNSTVVKVIGYVDTHARVSQLDLSGNNIGAEGAKLLAKLKGVDALFLASNHVGTVGAEALAKSSYKTINVESNEIGKKGIRALADSGKLVNIADNNLDGDDIIYLLKDKSIGYLNIKGATFNQEAIDALAANTTLTGLDLSYTNLKYDELDKVLANKKLTYLDISGVDFLFAKFLSQQTQLQVLLMEDSNMHYLNPEDLRNMPKLSVLDISSNNLISAEINAILNNVKPPLVIIDISSNKVDDSSIDSIKNMYKNYMMFYYKNNNFSYDGYRKLEDITRFRSSEQNERKHISSLSLMMMKGDDLAAAFKK